VAVLTRSGKGRHDGRPHTGGERGCVIPRMPVPRFTAFKIQRTIGYSHALVINTRV
jgi:hypothetical protein